MRPIHQSTSLLGILVYLVFSLLCLCCAERYLSYDELISLDASCAPDDTCSIPRNKYEDLLDWRTCQCKYSCIKYSTCCIDSPYIGFARCHSHLQESTKETCVNLMGTKSFVFAVDKCRSRKLRDPQIKALCEKDIGDFKDPLAVLPVTSLSSSTTYKNYFCALCNDAADGSDLVFWNIRINKARLRSEQFDDNELLQQLVYDDTKDQWGIVTANIPSKQFEVVPMSFDYPPYIGDMVNPCVPDLISSCHPDWRNAMIKYKCQRYMGMVYATWNSSENTYPVRRRFRNVHCAICNYADYDSEGLCRDIESFLAGPGLSKPSLSFSLLLDVNLSDGDRVGEVSKCKGKEVYDPFFKKCRTMVCVKPGYKLKNRKCVPS